MKKGNSLKMTNKIGYHEDIGLVKVYKNYNIIYSKDDKIYEKKVRTFNYLLVLTIFEHMKQHNDYKLIDIKLMPDG